MLTDTTVFSRNMASRRSDDCESEFADGTTITYSFSLAEISSRKSRFRRVSRNEPNLSEYAVSSLVEKDDVAILLPLMWHEQANKALDKLKLLEDDWDSYGADAPNLQSIRTARIVLYVAAEMGFEPISIDASVEGGVCISWLNGDRYGDIESFNSEELFAVNSSPADPAKAWEVESTLAGLRTAIERIRAFLNR